MHVNEIGQMDHAIHIPKPLPGNSSGYVEGVSCAFTAEQTNDTALGFQGDTTQRGLRHGLREGTTFLDWHNLGKIVAFDLETGLYQVEDPSAEYLHWTLMMAISEARNT
jgi:hypothetical protein